MPRKPGLTKTDQAHTKAAVIDLLYRTPIIESVCQKVGFGRATFYRWRADDADFDEKVCIALNHSRATVNDLAESKLLEAVKRGESWAIKYWLPHNNQRYASPGKIIVEEATTSNPKTDGLMQRALQTVLPGVFKNKKL